MAFDFRRYFHVSVDDIGFGISYAELPDLINELCRETGSHLYADLAGQDLVASFADIATWLHATAALNSMRDKDENPDPVDLPGPWLPERDESMVVSDAERDAAAAHLQAHSAIG